MDENYSRNNHEEVLSVLEDIDAGECRQIMTNFDTYMYRVRKGLMLDTLSAHLDKAESDYLKRDLNGEKKSLEHVWDTLKSGHFSDWDLKNEGLLDYITGSLLTVRIAKNRLKKLGLLE